MVKTHSQIVMFWVMQTLNLVTMTSEMSWCIIAQNHDLNLNQLCLKKPHKKKKKNWYYFLTVNFDYK